MEFNLLQFMNLLLTSEYLIYYKFQNMTLWQ